MALTKLPKNAIADGAIDDSKIEDGTIQNQEIQGSLTNEKFAGSIANDRLANSSLTVSGSTVSLGASTTIPTDTDWQALTVADGSTQVITEAGKGYFLDTNAGVIEVFLPSSPTRGDTVILADYAGTFGTNQIIINTGGENIDSTVGSEFKITTNNAIVECVYVDAAKGWLVYLNQAAGTTPNSILTAYGYDVQNTRITATGGTITTVDTDYKVHTFTGDGTFCVSSGAGPFAIVDYMVIGGGGGGGSWTGGGGGAGGFREAKTGNNGCHTASPLATCVGIQMSPGAYPVTVGGGGSSGSSGSDSIFSTITSAGGGHGQSFSTGGSGGSGGGSGGGSPTGPNPGGYSGGSGNTPPVSPPQGNNGGLGFIAIGSLQVGGGGGGAGATGQNAPSPGSQGGNGGNGVTTSINGSSTTRAGGGGGAADEPPGSSHSTGGSGGGGRGSYSPAPVNTKTAGSANTGSGGGGGGPGCDGSGGKGIVIIRYKFQ